MKPPHVTGWFEQMHLTEGVNGKQIVAFTSCYVGNTSSFREKFIDVFVDASVAH